MKKEEYKRNKILGIVLVVLVFLLLLFILFTNNKNNLKAHCIKAVCNDDNTICYNYIVNGSGKTIKTWEGNCSKIK